MKLTKKQAEAAGLPWPARAPRKQQHGNCSSSERRTRQALFIEACRAHGLPEPVPEYQFHPERLWRFDYAWMAPAYLDMLALEIQGGLFTGGRHVRGAALKDEHQKLNEGACLGWRILYCTPAEVEDGSIFPTIKRALGV